jgi:hypothetical protein
LTLPLPLSLSDFGIYLSVGEGAAHSLPPGDFFLAVVGAPATTGALKDQQKTALVDHARGCTLSSLSGDGWRPRRSTRRPPTPAMYQVESADWARSTARSDGCCDRRGAVAVVAAAGA